MSLLNESIPVIETKEEKKIKSLIEYINKYELKISEINNQIANHKSNGGSLTINNKRISELKSLQNNLRSNIINLNKNYFIQKSKTESEISKNKKLKTDLESLIIEYRDKLKTMNNLSFNSFLLTKYIISNNNDFLNQNQINSVLSNNPLNYENESECLSEIAKAKRESEIIKASENVIINNINDIQKKKEQINENLKMIKEEKNSILEELIDLLAYKESLEIINKKNMFNIVINSSNKNNIKGENYTEHSNINIYFYEIMTIDANIIADNLCGELFDIIYLYSKKNKTANNSNSIPKKNISYFKEKNISNNIKNSTIFPNSRESHSIDSYNNRNFHESRNHELIFSKTGSSFRKEKNYLGDANMINNDSNIILVKNSLKILIKNEIETFQMSINNNIDNLESISINDFLDNLSLLIINKMKNIDINLYLEKLNIYLSFYIKIFYYNNIIDNYNKFDNKDYKLIKKEHNKILAALNLEKSKLDTKQEEISERKIAIQNQIIQISNSNKNLNNKIANANLTKTEKNYLDICSKANNILKQKEQIENLISKYEMENKNNKILTDNKINEINQQIEKINQEIIEITNNNELYMLKNNEEIIKYRKIIAEKFDEVKMLLKIYKSKHGKNLSLYNQFIENINNSIKQNYNDFDKSKLNNGGDNTISNNYKGVKLFSADRINFDFKRAMTSTNFYKKNESNNNKKLNKTLNSIHFNDIDNKSVEMKKIKINQNFFNCSSLPNNSIETNFEKTNTKKKPNKIIINNNLNGKLNEKYNFSINNFIQNNIINRKEYSLNNYNNLVFQKKNRSFAGSENHIINQEDTESSNTNSKNTILMKKLNGQKSQSNIIDTSNILNINLFRNKKKSSNSCMLNLIPRGAGRGGIRSEGGIRFSDIGKFSNSNKNSAEKIKTEKYQTIQNNNNNNYLNKLTTLTKVTFCYYRELNNNNIIKYNPLKVKEGTDLSLYPYNFIKSTMSLSKNFDIIRIVPSSQLEQINIKINLVENTVVSSTIKTIIDIYRNYNKWKDNDQNEISLNDFIQNQINKYKIDSSNRNVNLTESDIKKCITNKNFNFSLIISDENNLNIHKRIEFIICSYDDFKMWINGMALIIKNKKVILKNNN